MIGVAAVLADPKRAAELVGFDRQLVDSRDERSVSVRVEAETLLGARIVGVRRIDGVRHLERGEGHRKAEVLGGARLEECHPLRRSLPHGRGDLGVERPQHVRLESARRHRAPERLVHRVEADHGRMIGEPGRDPPPRFGVVRSELRGAPELVEASDHLFVQVVQNQGDVGVNAA
jgi:hypothetical protein